MKLAPGTTVGSYRIDRFVASGGMGAIYEARHLELDRRVAIKVVADQLTLDPVGLSRFRREARAASTLSHPNICAVYDFHSEGALNFLVLEFLEGETLRDRLKRERLREDEIVEIGAALADALAHAHDRGLVHRDLKPSNVMLTAQGAKILDFGAVRRAPDPPAGAEGGAWTGVTESLTDEGHLVGTLPYMAPEQLDGRPVDHRADIHALGMVLYEMTTGRPPFAQSTPGAVAAAILRSQPVPIETLADDVSPHLLRVIERCMAKRPADRWQSARDLASELRWVGESAVATNELVRDALRGRHQGRAATVAGAVLAVAGAIALGTALTPRDRTSVDEEASLVLDLLPPAGVTFTERVGALSPEGRRFAFAGTDVDGTIALWIRDLRVADAERVPGSETALKPFWSPDGRSVAFFADGELRAWDVEERRMRSLARTTPDARGGSWGRQDVLLYAPDLRGGLFAVSASGGEPRRATVLDTSRSEAGHFWPAFLPDGRHFVVFVQSPDSGVEGVYLGSLDEGILSRMNDAAAGAVYSDGHILFERDGALVAQPFDPNRLAPIGTARSLLADIAVNFQRRALFSVSDAGTLAYSTFQSGGVGQLTLLDRVGRRVRALGEIRHLRNPDVSIDGRLVAVETYDRAQGDLWIMELDSDRARRLDVGSLAATLPLLSPDGGMVAFASVEDGSSTVFTMAIDRAEAPRRRLQSNRYLLPTDWTPDGGSLLLAERGETGGFDILSLDLETGSTSALFDTRHNEIAAQVSPSGRLIAYVSNESGSFEIYVETFPRSGPRCQLSAGSAFQPTWGATDEDLFYLAENGDVVAVTLSSVAPCRISPVERLFRGPIGNPTQSRTHFGYVAELDQLLFIAPAPGASQDGIGVVTDWRRALGPT